MSEECNTELHLMKDVMFKRLLSRFVPARNWLLVQCCLTTVVDSARAALDDRGSLGVLATTHAPLDPRDT